MNSWKAFVWLLIMQTIVLQSQAQLPLSARLRSKSESRPIQLLVKGDPKQMDAFLTANRELKVVTKSADIYGIEGDMSSLKLLLNQDFVDRFEDAGMLIGPMADSSRIWNNVDSVYHGMSPLSTNYRGRNIVFGIIDFGIEWRHPDFQTGPQNTRIQRLWDQNKDSIAPNGYSYGHLYRKSDIDSGFCRHHAAVQFGHGTNVAGIGVGNGTVIPNNRGNAPEAKIIAVSLKANNAWLANIADAVDFIFREADSLGLPCVINISVGGYDGSHDGRDLGTRLIESKLKKAGQVIVAAAGNAGHIDQHIQMQVNGDTVFTCFRHQNSLNGTYFNFWADTAEVRNLTLGIEADTSLGFQPRSRSYFFSFGVQFLDSLQYHGYYEDSVEIKNDLDSLIGKANFYLIKQENTINFQCFIKPTNANHLWRMSATGIGKLDMWVNSALQTTSNVWLSPLPDTNVLPTIRNYKLPDKSSSIVSSFQCSDKIITVGNFVNKFGITDIDTIYRPIGGVPQEIASNSSKGPTRDLRLKPDITAAGGQTMTTIDSITAANFKVQPSNRKKLGISGQYSVAGGTSMSSPAVAGIVALLFEKNPNLNYEQVKYLIAKTAKKDNFTSSVANHIYGHGKIDAMKLLGYSPTYGCRDTGSINYNPNADFEDSALCVKKIYGCTDTGSINYSPLANVDNGSCIRKVYGCMDTASINYNPSANIDNGSCIRKVYGCMDTGSINYNPLANVDNGSCIRKVYGCTDSTAINYNRNANVDDSSCTYPNLGLQIARSQHWNIYPNPSDGMVYVDSRQPRKALVEVFDMEGRRCLVQDFTQRAALDLKLWTRGLYQIVITQDRFIEKFKILMK